jgi:hypothetical protein
MTDPTPLFAYIDESYVDGHVYLVGAVVVTAAQHWALQLGFDDILWKTNRAHSTPLGLEFHGQNLFQQSDEWTCVRGHEDLAYSIYRKAMARIVGSGARIFIRGIDGTDRLQGRYIHADHPQTTGLAHLLERLNDYAARRGTRISVIADQVPDQVQHEQRMAEYQLIGTPGYRRSML